MHSNISAERKFDRNAKFLLSAGFLLSTGFVVAWSRKESLLIVSLEIGLMSAL